MKFRSQAFAYAALAILAGCGGGGGGGGGGGQEGRPANGWLQFTPSTVELTSYQGRGLEFNVTAKSSRAIPQSFNIGVIDPNGIIAPEVRLTANGQYEYQAGLKVSDKLAAGTHSGRLEVRLCEDAPQTCAKPIEGSPWFVPIQVTVKPATNLSALSPQPGLGVWAMKGGNPRHTGHVPLRLDPAKFSQRWAYNYLAAGPRATPPVLQDGVVFMLVRYGLENSVRAIDEASGKLLWQVSVPDSTCGATPLALAAGKVFVGTSNCAFPNGALLAYEQKTGTLAYRVNTGPIETEAAPLAIGDALYVHGRADIGIDYKVSRINASNGTISWNTHVPLETFQTLSADAEYLYMYRGSFNSEGSNVSLLRQSNGEVAVASLPMSSCYRSGTPVLGVQGQVYAGCTLPGGSGQLVAYDSSARKAMWSAGMASGQTPVLSGATLFAINGNTVEARGASDGKVLWSVNPQANGGMTLGELQDLLVTDNLLFVSGSQGVAAIDLASQKVVWTFPQGGPMAISANGVLYLPGPVGSYVDGTFPALVAVNLL